jgi:release factor glutamine methyltransferase
MTSLPSEISLARKVTDALKAGHSDQLERDLAYVVGQLSFGQPNLVEVIEQLTAGVSPYHVFGLYQLPSTHADIEVPRGVMPPGSMTEDIIKIIRSVCLAEKPRMILDVGCGTGVLGITALMTSEPMRAILLDLDWAAAACARRNLARLGLAERGKAVRGDGASSIQAATVDLLIANLPYVADSKVQFLPPRFSVHTPVSAIRGGGDGLDTLRQLAPAMGLAAAPNSHLILQTGSAEQQDAAVRLLAAWWKPVVPERSPDPKVLVAARRSMPRLP